MKNRFFFACALACMIAGSAVGQQLSLVIQMDPSPSPYLSDWRSKANTVLFVVSNPTGANQEVRLDAFVEGDRRGRVAETKLGAPVPPVVIPPGASTLNAVNAQLLTEDAVRYLGPTASEAMRSGRLPEDRYRLCVRLVAYARPEVALSPQACTRFEIKLIQPPELIAPQNASTLASPPGFQWSAVQIGTGMFAEYEVTLVAVDPGVTNVTETMETASPVIRREVRVPMYQYLPSDPPLEKGQQYAWRVRAYDPQNRYTFAHGGNSAVWTFTHQPSAVTFDRRTPEARAPELRAPEAKLRPGIAPVKAVVDVGLPMKNVQAMILTNCTVTGRYVYTFERGRLLYEVSLGMMKHPMPVDMSQYKPLANASVRLVRRYKTVPALAGGGGFVKIVSTGKVYPTEPKTVATGTTDEDGNFSFHFICADSTVLAKNVSLSNESVEFGETRTGTLYTYYTVEVVDPRYCSSGYQIGVNPGETKNVTLSSLVRTYNLDVQVINADNHSPLGFMCNVYIARPSKELIPSNAPEDEGELAVPVESGGAGAGKVTPQQLQKAAEPTHKFQSSGMGYVISYHPTTTQNKGHVLFTRLVRNPGGFDLYFVSARTPVYLPDGVNLNPLYFYNADKARWVQKPSIHTGEDFGAPDDVINQGGEFDPGYDYSAEVVFNKSFVITTFQDSVLMQPRLPRLLGRVKRSDTYADLPWVQVLLQKRTTGGQITDAQYTYTDSLGLFELAGIEPTGGDWCYRLKRSKFGYKDATRDDITVKKGFQAFLGEFVQEPRVLFRRRVVNEYAKPLAGAKGKMGEGAEETTGLNGIFSTRAVPGYQMLHMQKLPDYATKDSLAWAAVADFDVSLDDPSKYIVMCRARRRIEVRVLDPDGNAVEDAEVILEDKYLGDGGSGGGGGGAGGGSGDEDEEDGGGMKQAKPKFGQAAQVSGGLVQQAMQQSMQTVALWKRYTNEQGYVTFVYKSPESVAHLSVRTPGRPFVPQKITVTGIREDLWWTRVTVNLEAGGIVYGTVYAGELRLHTVPGVQGDSLQKPGKKKKIGQGTQQQAEPIMQQAEPIMQQAKQLHSLQVMANVLQELFTYQDPGIPNPPVPDARVWIDGYEELTVRTDADGHYAIIGVPTGARTIHACRQATSPDSQYIGEAKTVQVQPLKLHKVNFFLKQYLGMDITKIYGFPIELDALTELPGGNIRVDGAFVDVPQNSIFRLKHADARVEFSGLELAPGSGGPPPPALPVAGFVDVLPPAVAMVAFDAFQIDLQGASPITVRPDGADATRGRFRGASRIDLGSFNLTSQHLALEDSAGTPQELYLGVIGDDEGDAPDMHFAPLTSEGGTLDTRGEPLRIGRTDGSDPPVVLYGYKTNVEANRSRFQNNGMHLRSTVHVTVQSCGPTMGSSCDVAVSLGDIHVAKNGMAPLDPSQVPEQDIQLQKWVLHAKTFMFLGDYLAFDGTVNAPLLANVDNEQTRLEIPYKKMELRPDGLTGGDFDFDDIDLLGIAKLKLTAPFVFGVDGTSWFMISEAPYISGDMGAGKHLQGLAADAQILLERFNLRSNGAAIFTPAESEVVAWDVATFQPNAVTFAYVTMPFIAMQGALTLINVPDIAPQFTQFTYTEGGVFDMEPVDLSSPFNAGGVKMTLAHGLLSDKGFTAEGDWGNYHNRIFLQGQFSLNMSFRHKKIGPNAFSTIAEVINPDHAPPQNQSMFGNTSAADVYSVYGRTQLEADMTWSTNLSGWYNTSELAGKDSLYYVVVGTGGNGSVNTGNGTMKMQGTSGGLGMLQGGSPGTFPKGPIAMPLPEEEDDSPFSDLTITMDFEKMAIIASVQINAEISGGVSFNGGMTSVLSFGPQKFWSFIAYGTGKVANPPCSGSAVFLAGLNYEVSAEDRQIVVDYSISKQELPPAFNILSGFFTQVAVTMPIPGAPNFSIDLGFAGITVECSAGGEARVGLNFAEGTTFFIGVYCTAKVQVDAYVIFSLWVLGFEAEAHFLLKVEMGAWFTYNEDAGASFDFLGSILGKLDFGGCVIVMGEEVACGSFTLFAIGGEVKGRVGAGEYLDITPTFTFLGMDF